MNLALPKLLALLAFICVGCSSDAGISLSHTNARGIVIS